MNSVLSEYLALTGWRRREIEMPQNAKDILKNRPQFNYA